jgi:hypothetical protein
MSTLTLASSPAASRVEVTDEMLRVSLSDGREVAVPISWYPRLSHASPKHRRVWELVGAGHGIHWPELDEDISVENLLLGQPSGEGARSFSRWREWYQRKLAEPVAAPNRRPASRVRMRRVDRTRNSLSAPVAGGGR